MSILFADRVEESEADEIRDLIAKLTTPCDCGADNLPHEYGSACPAEPVAISEGRVSEPQKCKYGDHPATKSLIWAEGAAYVPVCDDHEAKARAHLGAHEVNRVISIQESAIIMARGRGGLAGRAYEEAKHPRGRGGKWTRSIGGHISVSGHGRIGSVQQVGSKFHAHGIGDKHIGEFPTMQAAGDAVHAHFLNGSRASKPGMMRRSPGERAGADSAPPEVRPAGLLTAQKVAQDRHRRLHNEGVAKDEVAVGDLKNLSDDEIRQLADRMMKTASLDKQPEAWRKALAKEANKRASKRRQDMFAPGDRVQHEDGSQAVVTGSEVNGRTPVKFKDGSRDPEHVFHIKSEDLESLERPKPKKPGSKMSRRSGHGLLTESALTAFDPVLHPRGRGGEFRDVLGRLRMPELHVRGTGMTVKASRRPMGTKDAEFERGARVILSGGRRGMVLHTSVTGREQFSGMGRTHEYRPPRYTVAVDGGGHEQVGHNEMRYDEAGMAERHGRAEEIAAKAEKGGVRSSSFKPVQTPVTLNASVVPGEWQVEHGYGEWQNPAHRNPGEGERVRIMPTHKTHANKTGTVTRDAYAETGRSGRTLIDVQFGSNEASVPISNQDVMREDQKAWVRQKPGMNVEKMIFHYLAGKPAPPNPAPGTAKFEQFSYGMKGGSKSGYTKRPANAAERGALIRKITQALHAREREDWDEYVRLLEVACAIRDVSDGLDEDDLEEAGLYDLLEATIGFDWNPGLHPRGRGGQFREVLAHLNVNGYHGLGHGVSVEKGLIGVKVHLPDGKTKSFIDPEKAVDYALMRNSDEARKSGGHHYSPTRMSPGERDSVLRPATARSGMSARPVLSQDRTDFTNATRDRGWYAPERAKDARRAATDSTSKAQALVDSGLADSLADARAQLADMGDGGGGRRSPGDTTIAARGRDGGMVVIAQTRRVNLPGSGDAGSKRADELRGIVASHQSKEIDGHLVDVQTANLLLKVYDALKPENKAKFGSVPLASLADLAWKSIQ